MANTRMWLTAWVVLAAVALTGCSKLAETNPDAPTPIARPGQLAPDWFPKTMAALRASPGCMGADAAELQSGKRAIFAWFKDKASVMAWYKQQSHQGLVDTVAPNRDKSRVPMAGVPDDVGPMLVVAAMSPIPESERTPGGQGMRLGIELYKPLEGGIRFGGGSFAPQEFKSKK